MESELANLVELALKEGVTYTTLFTEVQNAVELAFRKKYKEAGEISVVLDQQTDTVKILSNDKDVTPKAFQEEASRIARRIILSFINIKTPQMPISPLPPSSKTLVIEKIKRSWTTPLANILFWGYNGLYLLYDLVFLLSLLSSTVRESLSMLFQNGNGFSAIYLVLLLSYPMLIVYYVIKTKIYRTASLLMGLFFIVEIPMVMLTFFTLLAIPAPIPAVGLGLLLLFFIPPALYLTFNQRGIDEKTKGVFLVINTLGGATTAYLSILLSFWIPVLIGNVVEIIRNILFPHYYSGWESSRYPIPVPTDVFSILLKLTFAGILILLGAVVVLLPFFACYWFIKTLLKIRSQDPKIPAKTFRYFTYGTLALLLILFLLSCRQLRIDRYLTSLYSFSQAITFEQKESLALDLTEHKFELVDALKSTNNIRRYPFNKEDRVLEKAYESTLGVPNTLAVVVQELFDVAAAPLVYRGQTDYSGKLTQAYYDLFGEYPNQNNNYRTPVSSQNVEVIRTVTSKPAENNLAATITIEEQFQNKTYQNQEVIYEFSLAAEAVVTDLKLGPNLEFSAVVAPRGASETVYEREVNRSRDPALLEQTGPSQYRLRVFPIPGINDTTLGGKPQRMQFSYVTGLTKQGYPLPSYTKTNNVKLPVIGNYTNAQFVPAEKTVDLCAKFDPIPIDLAVSTVSGELVHNSKNEKLSALPCGEKGILAIQTLTDANIAVLLDVSYENRHNRQLSAFQKIINTNPTLVSNNNFDFFRFNTVLSSARKIKSSANVNTAYFGRSNLLMVLPMLQGSYDAVIVLTGQKEFAQGNQPLIPPSAPLYIVHTNNPPAYPQALNEYLLSSGGMAAADIEEALNYIALSRLLGPSYQIISGYWSIKLSQNTLPLTKITTGDPLSSLAAYRIFVNTLMQEKNRLLDLLLLDKFHEFASLNRFATPYSSFIALVNETQMRQLEEESKRYNRYREQPSSTFISPPLVDIRPNIMIEKMAPRANLPLFNTAPQMLKSTPMSSMLRMDGGLTGGTGFIGGGSANIGSFALMGPFIFVNVFLIVLGICAALVIYLKKRLHKMKNKSAL